MIIDSHFHLDERVMPLDNLLRKMDECGVDKTALMANLVDPFPEPSDLLVSMGQFMLKHRLTRNISKLILSRFTKNGEVKLPAGNFQIYSALDNEGVFAAVKKHPDRFCGWIFVNPAGPDDPVSVYNKWRITAGAIGVKTHPFWHRYNPVELAPVAALAARDGKPLLMHPGFGERGDFLKLKKEVPELKLILAHAGFPQLSDTWKKIKSDKSIFVDLSANQLVSAAVTREVADYLGPERCVFGTDGPFGRRLPDGTMDYGYLKRRIESLFPDTGVQKRIFCDNFLELTDRN
jgi:predicted TIM-barrel fold metal-dependent hydrolase